MDNLKKYNQIELNEEEMISIIGGDGFFREAGKALKSLWCGTKKLAKEIWSHSDKIAHPGSSFQ